MVQISSLIVAIKAKLCRENVSIATEIATQACVDFNIRMQDLASMERKMLQTLNWRVNAPTIHEFLHVFAPLMNNGEYFVDIARFHIDEAVIHPQIMNNYKPSVIAFAALMRADDIVYNALMPEFVSDNEDSDDDYDLGWEFRGEYDDLMDALGLDDRVVQEATFALTNKIPVALVNDFMAMADLGVPEPNARI